MNELDELFSTPSIQREQSFDKEAWVHQKQEQRQWTYDTIDTTTMTIVQNGEQFQRYLDVQSRFDRYSVSNALLILAQRPEATRIADFEGWKEQGVSIRRKETGFYILEPGEEYRREDGSTATSYNPKKMFDIAQTTAKKPDQPVYPDDRTRIKRSWIVRQYRSQSAMRFLRMCMRSTNRMCATLSSAAGWQLETSSAHWRRNWRMRKWIAAIVATADQNISFMPTVLPISFASRLELKRPRSGLTGWQNGSKTWSRSRFVRN